MEPVIRAWRNRADRAVSAGRRGHAAGFSLLELLMVMGLLVLLLGGLGVVSTRSSGRVQLDAAARQVALLLGQARDQAMAMGVPTRVLVDVTPAHAGMLRTLWLVQLRDAQWIPLGPALRLSEGMAVVPPLASDLGWTGEAGSASVLSQNGTEVRLDLEHPDGGAYAFVEFRADGRVDAWTLQDYREPEIPVADSWLQLTVSPCERGAGFSLRFAQPTLRRTLRIRPDGQALVFGAGG